MKDLAYDQQHPHIFIRDSFDVTTKAVRWALNTELDAGDNYR